MECAEYKAGLSTDRRWWALRGEVCAPKLLKITQSGPYLIRFYTTDEWLPHPNVVSASSFRTACPIQGRLSVLETCLVFTTSVVPLLNRPRLENQQVSTVTQYIKVPICFIEGSTHQVAWVSEDGVWIGLMTALSIRSSERSNNTALPWRQLASSGVVIITSAASSLAGCWSSRCRCSRRDS